MSYWDLTPEQRSDAIHDRCTEQRRQEAQRRREGWVPNGNGGYSNTRAPWLDYEDSHMGRD